MAKLFLSNKNMIRFFCFRFECWSLKALGEIMVVVVFGLSLKYNTICLRSFTDALQLSVSVTLAKRELSKGPVPEAHAKP